MQKSRFIGMNGYLVAGICFAYFSVVAPVCAQQKQFADATQQPPRRLTDSVGTQQLPEVEVTAQAHPATTKQTVPVQTLDCKSIKRLGIQELSEAVRRFAGVTVKDYGGVGGLKTVSIRSLGAHHTGVSYDGVAMSDAQSGQVDISRFTLDNVAMVTLSMGQPDDIFHSARIYASAGALEIKTQKPAFRAGNNDQLSVKLKGGSFGWLNPVLTYGRKLSNRWSASLYGDFMRADGDYPFTLKNGTITTREKRLNSDIKTFRSEANFYGDLGRNGSLDTKIYAFSSERGLPGAANFYNQYATERLWNDNSFVQTSYKNSFNKKISVRATAQYSYSYSRYREINDKYAAGQQEDRNSQQEYYGSAGVLYALSGRLSTSINADYSRTLLNNNFLNAPQPRRNTLLAAWATQYKSARLTATAGLLGAHISDELKNGNNPSPRRRLSPSASASWQPFADYAWRIRASYKDIFRAPTFTDLYYLRIGNTGLKPEKAQQYNVGLTWSGGGKIIEYASVSVDGYHNRVSDKIVALPTLYIWRMMNMGEVEITGVDVSASAETRLSRNVNINVSGNYTFQRAVDATDPKAKNYKHQIPYTPRHAGNSSVAIETPWANIAWLLTAVGERYALPQNTSANRIMGYAEQSVSASRSFALKTKRGVSLRVQGELLNLTGAQYDVIQYYPMPGRSLRLSVILNL